MLDFIEQEFVSYRKGHFQIVFLTFANMLTLDLIVAMKALFSVGVLLIYQILQTANFRIVLTIVAKFNVK